MTIAKTDLRDTRESAKEIRFYPNGAITAQNVQDALDQIGSRPPVITSVTISAADSPYAPPADSTYIYVNTADGPVEIDMPPSAARFDNALVIKDISGNGGANNVTIKAAAGEEIDGLPEVLIASDFGGYRLNPLANGYTVSP